MKNLKKSLFFLFSLKDWGKKGGNMDIQSTGTNHIQAFNLRAFATYGHKDHPLIFSLTSKTAFFGPFSFYYFSQFRLILKAIEDELCWSRPRPKRGKQFPFTKHITVLLLILWKLKEKKSTQETITFSWWPKNMSY